MIASNFVPGLKVVGKAAKVARATYKLASKSYKAVGKVTTNAKRVADRALRAPKTVGVKSYRTTKKLARNVKTKVQQHNPRKSRTKTSSSSSVSQRNAKTETRNVEYERKSQPTTQGADEIAATSELGAKVRVKLMILLRNLSYQMKHMEKIFLSLLNQELRVSTSMMNLVTLNKLSIMMIMVEKKVGLTFQTMGFL